MPLFVKNKIEAKLITDTLVKKQLTESFTGKDKWYKGMDVDQLSIEEAGFIANEQVTLAKNMGLINNVEADTLKIVIENYFKKELVKVRSLDELVSDNTRDAWMKDVTALASKYVGEEKVAKMLEAYEEKQSCNKESCCDKEKDCCKKEASGLQSEITCPKCRHKKMETMPTDVCLISYTCEKCHAVIYPKEGDCCVFCSYGTKKCPSKQE